MTSKDKFPNFIIVGAMKSGTSTLGRYLNHHPEIYLPKQELHFFNNDKKYNKGLDYYKQYFSHENSENIKSIGEKTPTYSYLKEIPGRIYTLLPDIKLIWIFRNPVDRAYSNYLHAYRKGAELLTFKEAINKEQLRLDKNKVFKGYLERSKYIDQVNNYLEYFDRSQMLFLVFEQFKANPTKELNRICSFLSVSEDFANIKLPEKVYNKTVIPKNMKMIYVIRKIFGKSVITNYAIKLGKRGVEPGYNKLDNDTRKELIKYYKPYNKKLEKIINVDLSIWDK